MYTTLNEALVKLKLNNSNYRPNIIDVLAELQSKFNNF